MAWKVLIVLQQKEVRFDFCDCVSFTHMLSILSKSTTSEERTIKLFIYVRRSLRLRGVTFSVVLMFDDSALEGP
jgi:hypothetical protein